MADKRVIEQTASSEIYNDDWFLKDSVLEGTTKISKDNLIDKIGASKIKSIAEDYDSTSTYNKDDFAFYENKLYRCLANNTTGTWDGTKWEEFDLPTVLITTAHNIETAEFTIGTYYSADDLVLKDGKLYQCVVGHNATEWKSQFWRSVTIDEMLGYLSDSIAPEHNQSTVYAVGDLVMHNKILWRCIQAGAGAFVNANWEEVTVADLIAEAGQIDDVQVKTIGDYETVVENKIAKIDLSSVTAYGEVPNLPQAIATFKDGADAPMKSLKVAIEPQQDLHGYDAPWAGGAGKNKFDEDTIYSDLLNDGEFVMQKDNRYIYEYKFYIPSNLLNQQLTFSAMFKGVENGNYRVQCNVNGTTSRGNNVNTTTYSKSSITFTPTTTSDYVMIDYNASQSGATQNGKVKEIQLEINSTATAFAPYSNICPISGWDEVDVTRTGKNLWGGEKLADDIVAKVPNATKNTTNKTVTYAASSMSGIVLFDKFKSNTRYSFYFSTESSFTNVKVVYTDNTQESPVPNTVYVSTANKTIKNLSGVYSSGKTTLKYEECGVFEGAITAQDFKPYAGNTYEINLDGTRYGGEVDLVSGVMTVDRGYKLFDGSDVTGWRHSGNYGISSRFDCQAIVGKPLGNVISNTFVKGSVGNDKECISLHGTNGFFILEIHTDRLATDDVAGLMSYFANNPLQLVYELATPLTIQLTPTAVKSLLGSNNVWADTGDINECVYRRDMSSTINDIIARIEALEG